MKPEELGCFKQVKDVLGTQGAIEELQKVIDCGTPVSSEVLGVNNSFIWDKTPQGWDFWCKVKDGCVPHGYTPPSSTKEIMGNMMISPEQMDEIKAFIVQTMKDNLNTNTNPQPQIRGVQVDYAVIDDPAANDDVFDEPAIEKWEPEGGKWYVDYDGCSELTRRSEKDSRNFGTERMTEQQADKARDEMRVFNRLLAYRDEFDPDFDFEGAGEGWLIYRRVTEFAYGRHEYALRNIGCVYMSKEVAEELCEKLNSGEVVL